MSAQPTSSNLKEKFLLGIKLFLGLIGLIVYIFCVAEAGKWLHAQAFFSRMVEFPFLHNLATLFIFAIITQVLLFLLLTLQSQWKKPRIFLSHKGELNEKAAIIKGQLEQQGFIVFLLPFSTNYTHDYVIKWVRDHIRKSHAMVVIPDAQKTSFVDSEILAASVKGIPIVVMQHANSHIQPSTLLRGFPVFDFEKIQEDQSIALSDYLLFAIQHQRDLWRNFQRHFNWQLYAFGLFIMVLLAIVSLANPIYDWLIGWVIPNYHTDHNISQDPVFAGTTTGIFIIAMIYLFFDHRKNLNISRQEAVTGIESFEEFSNAFTIPSDKRILKFINKNDFKALGSEE